MKIILFAFRHFVRNIWKDWMLTVCLVSPVLMSVAFKYVLPFAEAKLCSYFNQPFLLSPYYSLFDLLISYMTPLMICFSGTMVILEEMDDQTARYLTVTPLGTRGYLISRICILPVLSLPYTFLLLHFFALSWAPWYIRLSAAAMNAAASVLISMLVVSFAHNKVEGMALIKFSNLVMAGFIAVYFLKDSMNWISGVLPTFWSAKIIREQNPFFFVPGILLSVLYLRLLYTHFSRKLFAGN